MPPKLRCFVVNFSREDSLTLAPRTKPHFRPDAVHCVSQTVAIKALIRIAVRYYVVVGGSVAEWLACWTQAQKGPRSNRNRDAVG